MDSKISVNNTVASTRSGSGSWRTPVRNSSTSPGTTGDIPKAEIFRGAIVLDEGDLDTGACGGERGGQSARPRSDDDGVTWHRTRARFDMGRGEWTPRDPATPTSFIGIYAPHVTSWGDVLFSFARYGLKSGGKRGYGNWMTEAYLLRLDNILTETDPEKLTFKVLPEGPCDRCVHFSPCQGGASASAAERSTTGSGSRVSAPPSSTG